MQQQQASIDEFKREQGDRPTRSTILSNITYYKNQAIDRMLRDDDLMKLIYYPTGDALSLPSLTEEQKNSLVFKNIYPYTVADDIITEKISLITMEFTIIEPMRRRTDHINGILTFYIQCHKDIMNTHHGVRKDVIVDRMDTIFNGSVGIGMNEMKPESLIPFWHQRNDWGGYELSYRVGDFR